MTDNQTEQYLRALAPAARHLLADGYAMFPVGIDLFAKTARLFEKLLRTETPEYIRSWELTLWEDDEADDGIIDRSDEYHDKKIFFHYRPWLPDALHKHGVAWERHQELLTYAMYQHIACLAHMRLLGKALDREAPGYRFVERLANPEFEKRSVLRYLWYKSVGTKAGDILAKEHQDRGLLTFHLWERFPGLDYYANAYIPYIPRKGIALAFWGKKARDISDDVLSPLVHRVVNRNGVSSEQARMACVFFGHIAP